MTNTNCLENIKCPKCGNEQRFRIRATILAIVTDDGTEDYEDLDWNEESYIDCPACMKSGTVAEFTAGSPA